MTYASLYDYCQELTVPVSRADIVPKVVELARRPRGPLIMLRGMDPQKLAGFTVWPGPDADPHNVYVKWGRGEPVIVVARDLNYCWKRFVVIKELMHYFDRPLEKVTNAADFAALVSEFSGPQIDRSNAMGSEVRALWMALGVICPENLRQQLESRRLHQQISDMDIAQMLKMPVVYVPLLFQPHYKQLIANLLCR